jgi:hypothetical protein
MRLAKMGESLVEGTRGGEEQRPGEVGHLHVPATALRGDASLPQTVGIDVLHINGQPSNLIKEHRTRKKCPN